MKFATVDLPSAKGHILAHTVSVGASSLKKGITLDDKNLDQLRRAKCDTVTVAMLEKGDITEDEAAKTLAKAFLSKDIKASVAFAGRVNLIADADGVIVLDTDAINAFNFVDHAITIATLNTHVRVKKGALLATLKIIPYGVSKQSVLAALACLGGDSLKLYAFKTKSCDLILTSTQGFKASLLAKAERTIKARIAPLNMRMNNCQTVDHNPEAIKAALDTSTSDMVLILGASATSDIGDVVPAGILAANGTIERFGMPVDPGNLLLLGAHQGRAVVGLPGCARAPALNGADWVLARLCADIRVNAGDISRMGVGGLLKEIPERIQPRMGSPRARSGVTAVILAAGQSRRMQGSDKLLRHVGDEPMLRHCVKVALASAVDHCIVVLRKDAQAHRDALLGLPVQIVEAKEAPLGMSASLSAGVLAIKNAPKAILIALADMPDVTPEHFNAAIDAHEPNKNRLIICPVNPRGKRGHPVLFDAKYAENLAMLEGDTGAKNILQKIPECVFELSSDNAVCLDLDTPEAWRKWENPVG